MCIYGDTQNTNLPAGTVCILFLVKLLCSETDVFRVTGLEVYALWKDKVCYSGRIKSVISDRQALVAFDDGNELSVRLDRIIACNLLPVGWSVLAPRSDDQSWSELATVVSHYESDTENGHTVEFVDDKYRCK